MLDSHTRSARVVALAAAALVSVPVLVGSASAATTTTPAVGSSGASITVLQVDTAAASLRALTASLSSSTASKPSTASVSVAPLWSSVTGTVGGVTVGPSDSPKHIGAGTIAIPGGLGSLSSPAVDVVASVANGAPIAGITAGALGQISVLGTSLSLGSGALDLTSKVTSTFASSTKSVSINQLALPTIADLLASLGLDLAKLTQGQLNALLGVVTSTVSSAIAALNAQIDAAQATLGTTVDTVAGAQSLLASQQAALSSAQANLTAAQAAAASALAAVTSALAPLNAVTGGATSLQKTALAAAGVSGTFDANSWQALSTTAQNAVGTILGAGVESSINAAVAALNAVPAVATAQALVATVQALVDAAQALLAALLGLLNAITAALDADPLALLGGIDAGTSAIASKTATADGHLTVGSVEVLGVTQAVGNLTSALGTVTSALSSVLNNIAGVTFTAPKIEVGAVTKTTQAARGTASALVTVTGVKVTLPTLQLPASLGLVGAAALPGVDLVNGVLSSLAGSLTLAQLQDSATFVQGTTTTSTTPGTSTGGSTPTGGGSLPTTGLPAAVAALALLAIVGAAALRRRARGTEI